MSLLLYIATAALLVFFAQRFITPIAWRWRVVLVALPLVFTGRALLTDRVYAPVDLPYNVAPLAGLKQEYGVGDPHNILFGDLYTEIVPWRAAVRSEIAHGRWPIWNPHVLAGEVLAAAAQPAAYSPFTLLALLLPAAKSFTFSAALTFLLAGLGAFLLARELGCAEVVASIAAAGWMFSTSIAFFVLWPLGASWALLPAVLVATRRVATVASFRSVSLFAVTLSLLVLQGHPETTFHVCAIAAAYFLVHARSARAFAGAAAGALVAALVCAIYLLPVMDAIPQSREHEHRVNVWAVQPRGIPIARAEARISTDFFPFLHARKWASADVGAVNLDTMAVGSILLAAALFGVWRARNRDAVFFAFLFLFALLAQMEQQWFEVVLQHLPLFRVALNSRFVFGGAFAIVMLGALGIEKADRAMALTMTIVLVMLGAGTFWLMRAGVVVGPMFPWAKWRVAGDLAPLAIACIALWSGMRGQRLAAAMLVLVVAQRWISDGRIYPAIDARAAYPHIPLLDRIDRNAEPFRVTGVGQAFPPGTSTFYDLEDVRGYEPMLLREYLRTYLLWCAEQPVWFNRVDDLTRPFLSFLNVRYAIASDEGKAPDGWREVARDRGAVLLENMRVLPRVIVPTTVRLGTTPDQAIYEMYPQQEFASRAWIAAEEHAHDRANGPGSARFTRSNNEYRIEAAMQGDGWIVISEPAWKGWRAYVDGKAVRVQTANVAFLSVFVPAGTHEIRVVYRPSSFTTGRAISIATLIALAGITVWRVLHSSFEFRMKN